MDVNESESQVKCGKEENVGETNCSPLLMLITVKFKWFNESSVSDEWPTNEQQDECPHEKDKGTGRTVHSEQTRLKLEDKFLLS